MFDNYVWSPPTFSPLMFGIKLKALLMLGAKGFTQRQVTSIFDCISMIMKLQ